MKQAWFPLMSAAALLATPSLALAQETPERAVAEVLDAFHAAASAADGDTYFGLFAEEGIFLGTDATERWTVEEFRDYAMPHFSQGRGWTYEPTARWVTVSSDGNTAWFDERLFNVSLGDTRGSGVLVLRDGSWKIAQYNLTIPIPNPLARDVVRRIREFEASGEGSAP